MRSLIKSQEIILKADEISLFKTESEKRSYTWEKNKIIIRPTRLKNIDLRIKFINSLGAGDPLMIYYFHGLSRYQSELIYPEDLKMIESIHVDESQIWNKKPFLVDAIGFHTDYLSQDYKFFVEIFESIFSY